MPAPRAPTPVPGAPLPSALCQDSEEAKANALLDVNAWFEQEKSKFDAKFTDLHSQFKQKVEEDLTAAGDAVRKLLADPDAFKAAAVEKLEAISQDLLAHSKNLAGLTAKKLASCPQGVGCVSGAGCAQQPARCGCVGGAVRC